MIPTPTTTTVQDARLWAIEQHGDQKYGEHAYIAHLDAVAATLKRYYYGTSDELMTAAYLHDVVEDTDATVELVAEKFGFNVALLVWAVTNEDGANHVAKFAMTAPKITATPKAAILKEADRLANVRQSIATGESYLKMYQKEHPLFKAMLFGKGDPDMERDLDRLLTV